MHICLCVCRRAYSCVFFLLTIHICRYLQSHFLDSEARFKIMLHIDLSNRAIPYIALFLFIPFPFSRVKKSILVVEYVAPCNYVQEWDSHLTHPNSFIENQFIYPPETPPPPPPHTHTHSLSHASAHPKHGIETIVIEINQHCTDLVAIMQSWVPIALTQYYFLQNLLWKWEHISPKII